MYCNCRLQWATKINTFDEVCNILASCLLKDVIITSVRIDITPRMSEYCTLCQYATGYN